MPNLIFSTDAERENHPLAQTIPQEIWNVFFQDGLTEKELALMGASSERALALLNSAPYQDLNDNEKKRCLLVMLWTQYDERQQVEPRYPNLLRANITYLYRLFFLPSNQWLFVQLARDPRFPTLLAQLLYDAVTQPHLIIINRLTEVLPKSTLASLMFNLMDHDNTILTAAIQQENSEILIHLCNIIHTVHYLIVKENYGILRAAFQRNDLMFIERFIHHALTTTPIMKMTDVVSRVFSFAAEYGQIQLLNQLIQLVPNKVLSMVQDLNYGAFRYAAMRGRLDVLNRLIELAPNDVLSMVRAMNYSAFRSAASGGHLGVINRLIELAPNDVLSMLQARSRDAYRYTAGEAFRYAASHGHLDVLNRFIELAPDEVLSMERADHYRAFIYAAERGHLAVLNLLIERAPDDVLPMLRARDYEAFRYATANGYIDIVNQLLTYPSVLAYAEMHVREYGERYVQPFINVTIHALRTDKTTFEQANPHGVFDLDSPERAQSCFYMLRHLIRCNDARYSDDIRFLLSIPAVRALAPATVTPNEANELLRLALTLGNQAALEILLTIPAVRELAEQNNYYQHEQQGGIDLRALAQDRESSMSALSVREQRQIQAAITRYQPMIQARGVAHIMSDLRERLAERYAATPARLTRDDRSTLLLPMTWEAFHALALSRSEHKRALQAYYQHPDHNAWRYLLKPNPWIHALAPYAYMNPSNHQERWSTFDKYEYLISLLYLAAMDAETPAEDGHTVDTRFTLFIAELAHIGRAHNWDTRRLRINAQGRIVYEEYDDLQGDKPSCYSGVKRRLFQAVQGHPLFKPLTLNVIKEELREFMRQHFVNAINENNQDALKEAWLALCEGEADDGSFDALNVSEAQQRDFFDYLTQKYATEFTDNSVLTTHLRDAFQINDNYPSHVARFAMTTDFASLLPTTSSLRP